MCDYPTLARIADALERMADHLTRDAQPAAPDMSAALEAEYQRGRADGARQQREADKWNLADAYLADAARALGTHLLITDATSDQENYGDGPQ